MNEPTNGRGGFRVRSEIAFSVLSVLLVVINWVYIYGGFVEQNRQLRTKIEEVEKRIEAVRVEYVRLDLHSVEMNNLTSRLTELGADLKEIKRLVK